MFNKYRQKKSRKPSSGADFNLFEPSRKTRGKKKKPRMGIINNELDSGNIYVGLKREHENPDAEAEGGKDPKEEKKSLRDRFAIWLDSLGSKKDEGEISFSGRYSELNSEIPKEESETETKERNIFDIPEKKRKTVSDYLPSLNPEGKAYAAFDWAHEHIVQIIVVVVVLSGLAATVQMVATKDTEKDADKTKKTVMEESDTNYIGIAQPESFNALASNDDDVYYINQLVYSQLFRLDENLNIEKDLVDDYSADSAKGTVSITLKSGVKFSDGSELTSADVRATVNSIKSVGSKSPYYTYVSKIDSVSTDGDRKLTITFSSPADAALDNLVFPIVSADSYSEKENFVIGSGPYAYSSYTTGKEVKFKKNEYYYGKKANKDLAANIIEDQSQNIALMSMDVITVMLDKDTDADETAKAKDLDCRTIVSNELEYIGFNHTNAVLKNKEVRYAIAYALDRDEIVEDAYGSAATVTDSMYYPGFLGSKSKGILLDQKKTSDSLKKAGYNDEDKDGLLEGSDGKPLTIKLLVNSNNKNRLDAAESIKEQLKTVGITVQIESVANDTYLSRLKSGNFEMYLGGLKIDKQFNLTDLFGDKNFGKYKNSDVISKVAKLETTLTEDEQLEAFEAAKKALEKEMPFVPICYKNYYLLSNSSYKSDTYGTFFDRYRGLEQGQFEKKVTKKEKDQDKD